MVLLLQLLLPSRLSSAVVVQVSAEERRTASKGTWRDTHLVMFSALLTWVSRWSRVRQSYQVV